MIGLIRHRLFVLCVSLFVGVATNGCSREKRETIILNGDVSLWEFEVGAPVVFQNRIVGNVAEMEIDELEVCYMTIVMASGGTFSSGVSKYDYSVDSLGQIVIELPGERLPTSDK